MIPPPEERSMNQIRANISSRLTAAALAAAVVLSSAALHNIYDAGERQAAVREIARVLESGGRLLILDVRHITQYAATLCDAGVEARCVQGIVARLLAVITFGSIRWGYVIGGKK